MRVHLLVAALVLGGCGASLTDLCRDECAKLNACGAVEGSNPSAQDCTAACPDIGISVTSTSACPDIGGADDCINAVTPSGSGPEAASACDGQVTDCLSQHCSSHP